MNCSATERYAVKLYGIMAIQRRVTTTEAPKFHSAVNSGATLLALRGQYAKLPVMEGIPEEECGYRNPSPVYRMLTGLPGVHLTPSFRIPKLSGDYFNTKKYIFM